MQVLTSYLKRELGIPQELLPQIAKYYKKEEINKHEFLVKKGSLCNKLCFIESGYWRFFTYSEKKAVTHWIFGANQIITDMASFYLREDAKWNIQALSKTEVYTLNYSDFQLMRTAIPEWDAYEKQLMIKLLSAMENRVYALLSMTAEERYKYLYASDRRMFQELPLNYLASMLGMTPETLSRIRKKFSEQ